MFGRSSTPQAPETTSFLSGPFLISLDSGNTADFITKENNVTNGGQWMRLTAPKQVTVGWRYDYAALTDGILVVVE